MDIFQHITLAAFLVCYIIIIELINHTCFFNLLSLELLFVSNLLILETIT